MTRVEGVPGIHKRIRWQYRGYTVHQVMRSFDVRNKTNNGFDWLVEVDGVVVATRSTRAKAKDYIDSLRAQSLNSP